MTISNVFDVCVHSMKDSTLILILGHSAFLCFSRGRQNSALTTILRLVLLALF